MEDENAQAAFRWLYDLMVVDKILPAPGELNAGSDQLEGKITMNWYGSLFFVCVILIGTFRTNPLPKHRKFFSPHVRMVASRVNFVAEPGT